MSCSDCGTFKGKPFCGACRAIRRIQTLLRAQVIAPDREGLVLDTLRGAAGVLADLAEVCQAEKESRGLEAHQEETSGLPSGPTEEKKSKVKTEEGESEYTDESEESEEGVVDPPEEGGKEKVPEKADAAVEEEEEKDKDKKEPASGSGDKPVAKPEQKKDTQDLKAASPKKEKEEGAAASKPAARAKDEHHADQHRERKRFAGSDKPPEPAGPPPGHRGVQRKREASDIGLRTAPKASSQPRGREPGSSRNSTSKPARREAREPHNRSSGSGRCGKDHREREREKRWNYHLWDDERAPLVRRPRQRTRSPRKKSRGAKKRQRGQDFKKWREEQKAAKTDKW